MATWDKLTDTQAREDMGRRSWGHLPQVQRNFNRQITGDPDRYWVNHFVETYFERGWAGDTLVLGCGAGDTEHMLYNAGMRFKSITGYDISPVCIRHAGQRARPPDQMAQATHYHTADLNTLELPVNSYDFILFFHALHHVENVAGILEQVYHAMRKSAIFLVQEFVGPSRFQWTDEQMDICRNLLATLPEHLRMDLATGITKQAVTKRSVETMIALDPSEAVNSEEIDWELRRSFYLHAEPALLGGTILHPMLEDIAGNFRPDNAYHNCIAELLVEYETALIRNGVIPSDFQHYVLRK